jgi:hypothetical protein
MVFRDSSKLEGLLDDVAEDIGITEVPKKIHKSSNPMQRFITKLNEKDFEHFNTQDWLRYWNYKRNSHGLGNYIPNCTKDCAILKSLMKNFKMQDIKLMIDFLYDASHDLYNKKKMGIWILSKGWLNEVYQSAQMWKDGEYKTRAQERKEEYTKPIRNREWTGNTTKTENKSHIRV